MYVLCLCEEFAAESAEAGFNPPTILVDLKGLSLSHIMMLGWCQQWAEEKQERYSFTPGTKTYLCGVSYAVTVIWGMVKHWLRPEIQESIQFLSTDEMPLLLEECGADNLPAWVFESSAAVRAQALEQTPGGGQAGETAV